VLAQCAMTEDQDKRLPRKKANPAAELPINNMKYKTACTELHLADRGLDKIRGFEDFICLEVLWLNNNKITSLNHLDSNFRLKFLYMSNNKVFTLVGSSLRNLRNLEVLLLANNQLTDLSQQINELVKLPFLRQLELIGNPVCEESNYRLFMIHSMPGLQVLDRHVITDLERLNARQMAQQQGWLAKRTSSQAADPEKRPIQLKKRGRHSLVGIPLKWRPRPFMGKMYHPPRVHKEPYDPNYETPLERELHVETYKIKRHMAKEERARLNSMFVPIPVLKADFRADFYHHEDVTPQQAQFREHISEARGTITFDCSKPGQRGVNKICDVVGGAEKKEMCSIPQSARDTSISLDKKMWSKFKIDEQRAQTAKVNSRKPLRL